MEECFICGYPRTVNNDLFLQPLCKAHFRAVDDYVKRSPLLGLAEAVESYKKKFDDERHRRMAIKAKNPPRSYDQAAARTKTQPSYTKTRKKPPS